MLWRSACVAALLCWCAGRGAGSGAEAGGMAPLLRTQAALIQVLDNYLRTEYDRIYFLEKQLDVYRQHHGSAMAELEQYLDNHINSFTLTHRLTNNLRRLQNYVDKGVENAKNVVLLRDEYSYPSIEDMRSAAIAVARLQDSEDLDTEQVAEGNHNGVTNSVPMTAWDCFELGRSLYESEDFNKAISWMSEALQRTEEEEEDEASHRLKADILEILTKANEKIGNKKHALHWAKQLISLEPRDVSASSFVSIYEKKFKKVSEESEDKTRNATLSLCKGDLTVPLNVSKKLKCRYSSNNNPYLKLAPLKLEEMYLDPDVYVFHDVIRESEIDKIKELATPFLFKATVRQEKTGKAVVSEHRIGNMTWLDDPDHELVAKLSRRVSDITGLSVASAEMFQVFRYGVGGYYLEHTDFIIDPDKPVFTDEEGNRIATFIYYISEVEEGGATVFPYLGVRVPPEKGSALLWWNLNTSGQGDELSTHAGCPVLKGVKWILNKWIHEAGQELTRPCGLVYEPEGFSATVPDPIPTLSV